MKKLIKIYGERNTNTNYISKLIQLNLNVQEVPGVVPPHIQHLQETLPGKELVKDLYFYLTCKHNLGWKHTCVKPVSALKKYNILANDISFLTITKNPYSWLLSLHRNPYHLYCGKPDFETFLVTPLKTIGRDNCSKTLRNPMELWNVKNASYLQLTELSCLNITTESIFEDPKKVVNKIGAQFSIDRISSEFVDFEQSTKDKNKDTHYYRNYYLNEIWKDSLSNKAITIINESLDRNLMNHFGYEVLS